MKPQPRLRSLMAVPDLLNPKLDLVFKMLLAKPSNSELLLSLLNATLPAVTTAVSLEVLNPELPKHAVDDKGVVLDILVRLGPANGQVSRERAETAARRAHEERAPHAY